MALSDEYTGVVDRFGETGLEDLSLESSLHEVLNLQGEYVIETHAGLVEYSNSHKSSVMRGKKGREDDIQYLVDIASRPLWAVAWSVS